MSRGSRNKHLRSSHNYPNLTHRSTKWLSTNHHEILKHMKSLEINIVYNKLITIYIQDYMKYFLIK